MTEHHPGFLALGALGAAMDEAVRQLFAGFQAGKAQAEARIRAEAVARSEAALEAHRREQQRVEDEARRARLAAFEASDPAGRLVAMNREHRAVASRLAAEYGFPDPATISPERRRQLLNAEPRSWGLAAHEYFGYLTLVDNR